MIKKFLFMLVAIITVTAAKADINGFKLKNTDQQASVGLFLGFSGVDSKFENDDVVVEIYDGTLWLQNKTNKTLYLDLSQGYVYFNDEVIPFYVNDKKKGNVVTEDQFRTIAPQQTEGIVPVVGSLSGKFSAYEGKDVHKVNKDTKNFMRTVDELRQILENGANSAFAHYTEDESFIKIKAALSYSFNKSYTDPVNLMVSSWVSDLIIAKYYPLAPPQQKKEKSLFVKDVNPGMVCTAANSPFEYDEEKSPIMCYDLEINLNKGEFTLSPITFRKLTKNVFKALGAIYTAGLIDPVEGNQTEGIIIRWLGPDADFSKIKDDKKGTVVFGEKKKNSTTEPITVTNTY